MGLGALDDPARIEAASFRGKPVSFVVVGPWTSPEPVQRLRRWGCSGVTPEQRPT